MTRSERVGSVAAFLIEQALRYDDSGQTIRRRLCEAGAQVVPANFYSPVPTAAEIERSFEYRAGAPPYDHPSVFDRSRMQSFLAALLPYAEEFAPPAEGNVDRPSGYFWGNPAFSFSDAMAYYCILRHLKPQRVLEVGSGFSTMVAREALCRNGHGELRCIEPYPRDFLRQLDLTELIEKPVQEVPLEFFADQLGDGDVLFIDSTHTVKTGCDCLYLYLKVLPSLERRTMIHAHDVFLPYAYPQKWQLEKQVYWTEAYLLYALLLENPRFEVCFGSNWHHKLNREQLEHFMGGKWGAGGGSLWFWRNP